MKIIVLIKQVPDTDNVKLDTKTGTMIREGLGTIINPLDLNAIEEAKKISKIIPSEINVITMGPPAAEEAIKEAIAMGADKGYLVSDRKFAGSDSWATSMVLAETIKKTGNFDLILAGEKAIDGETGQVGPEVASMLDIPFSTYVTNISVKDNGVEVVRTVEDGYQNQFLPFPCLLTVLSNINEPSIPNLEGKIKARKYISDKIDSNKLKIEDEYLGLKGSPTRVVKISTPKIQRQSSIYKGSEIDNGIKNLIKKLQKMALI